MKLAFTEAAWQDYLHWQEHDRAVLSRVNNLLRDAKQTPFTGIGKPEPLRGDLKGWWSRRITGEHRLVYRISGPRELEELQVLTCRFHYRR